MNDRLKARLLITDLDNTLFDWFSIWHASFASLMDAVSIVSGLPMDRLLADARTVHQRHGTSEYSFLLNEMACLKALHPNQEIGAVYADAIHQFRSARKSTMRLYPGVMATLEQIRKSGAPVVAYTDSFAFPSMRRMKALGLDGVVVALYSPPDHGTPEGMNLEDVRSLPPSEYEFANTDHRILPEGSAKPDPAVLSRICDDFDLPPSQVVYVGDSLIKDVAMAQAAGALDAWARYGESHHLQEYELLRKVSHWSDADIARERRLAAETDIESTRTLRESFAELLDHFEFEKVPR
jgi:phosphoglycolate phosphatase